MPTILVADDYADVREVLSDLLEAKGFNVLTAVDGEHAWEILQDVQVDVVLSDIDMPRLDGVSLGNRLQQTPVFKGIPIILVSGKPPPVKPSYVFDLLLKPVQLDTLFSMLDRAISLSRPR